MKYKNIEIVGEDNHILVACKPAGMLSQKDITGDDSILEELKEYIKIKYNKPGNVFLGSVHRIDRPASGLLVFAKTSKALSRLTESMRAGRFSKKYLVLLDGKVRDPEGFLSHYLLKDSATNTVKVFNRVKEGAKLAKLKFKCLAIRNGRSLLEVDLLTGRPHQIRAQLSNSFFPIVGDTKYGSKLKSNNHRIYLHSYRLDFPHPTLGEEVHFISKPGYQDPVWAEFANFIDEYLFDVKKKL